MDQCTKDCRKFPHVRIGPPGPIDPSVWPAGLDWTKPVVAVIDLDGGEGHFILLPLEAQKMTPDEAAVYLYPGPDEEEPRARWLAGWMKASAGANTGIGAAT